MNLLRNNYLGDKTYMSSIIHKELLQFLIKDIKTGILFLI